MRRVIFATTLLGATAVLGPAVANDALMKLMQDPKQWVMPTATTPTRASPSSTRSTRDNVGKLQVAWTFSTGVLRGHEGGPLVIGDTMYVHTPFPNIVYALDLNDDGAIKWKYEPKQDPNVIPVMCCDTVNRGVAYADGKHHPPSGRHHARRARRQDRARRLEGEIGDPSRAETGTDAPLVVKDKVIVGMSGGEFGVQGYVAAYNVKAGKLAGAPTRSGPTTRCWWIREKTTHLGKPVGKDSGTKTWEGDQWKIGGGDDVGLVFLRSRSSNLVLLRHRQPLDLEPEPASGRQRWSMTIFARDPDDGMAKWVYQMTPHDEWDFDGINEMILADSAVGGQTAKALVHFDRNGFGYTLDRDNGELLVAEKYDPVVNWASSVDMDKNSATYGRPQVVSQFSTEVQGEDVNVQGICPAALGTKDQQPAAFSPRDGAVLRADQPRLHGLRAVQGELHGGSGLCRRDAVDVSRPEQPRRHGQLHRLGRHDGQDRVVDPRAVLGLGRRARDGRRRRLLRHARGLPEGGRRQDGQGTLQVQDPVRHHRQRR